MDCRRICCFFLPGLIAFLVVGGLCSLLVAQSPPDQWLVLNNDQCIRGVVTLDGDRYSVATETGSRIYVAKSQVSFVADSVVDIYWDKWSRVDPEDPQSHINLFRWCLKNEMLKEAQKQIDLVAKIENMDDHAGHLSRMAQELEIVVQRKQQEALAANKKELKRLNIRNLPPVAPDAQFASAPTIPSVPLDAEGRPMRQLEPLPTIQNQSDVALVDFEEEVEAEVLVARREKPAWVSNRQLDRETRKMPAGTVNFYKRHIEPKIIENCVACHDSRSHSLPLSKRSFGQTIPRRMSQQNLHFVVEQVNRTAPFESPLLQMAITAHGEQKAPSFALDDPVLFDLKKWVVAISDDPAKWLMQLSEESRQEHSQIQPVSDPPSSTQAAVTVAPVAEGPLVSPPQPKAVMNKAKVNEIELEPSDPYDPAGFNRK